MTRYSKAIAAFLTGAVALAAQFAPGVEDVLTPEMIQSIALVASTVLVYAVPNRET